MASTKTHLTASNIRTIPVPTGKAPRLVCDGGGLNLQITPAGSRSYILRYTIRGKTRAMGLGSIERISLSDARKLSRAIRVQIDKGIDPLEEKSAAKAGAAGVIVHRIAFARCAELYIESHQAGWKNPKHIAQWRSTLETYAYPVIGKMPVADVGIAELKKILTPIWSRIPESASRLRGRIEKILGWATVQGHRSGENPARWSGFLSEIFPRRSLIRQVEHHGALPYTGAAGFMKTVRAKGTMAAFLLEFIALTGTRTGEARGATWQEIDLSAKLWTIPASRMKAKREHRVPLSAPALELLRKLKGFRDAMPEALHSTFVFPSANPKRSLSDMAVLALIQRGLGRTELTTHGLRSTFRDWAAECTDFPREVAEAALAHTLQNKVEAAYRRGDLLEKRRELMEAWGAFCG